MTGRNSNAEMAVRKMLIAAAQVAKTDTLSVSLSVLGSHLSRH